MYEKELKKKQFCIVIVCLTFYTKQKNEIQNAKNWNNKQTNTSNFEEQ